MNYIKEINAFYDRQEQTPLSGAAVALWYALMHINNKTRWKNRFTSPGSVLRNKAGLTESSFKRARAELVEHGYIEVESPGRGKTPVYMIRSLVEELERGDGSSMSREAAELENASCMPAGNKEVLKAGIEAEDQGIDVSNDRNQGMDHTLNQQAAVQATHVLAQHMTQLPDQVPAPLNKQYINETNTKPNDTVSSAAKGQAGVFVDGKMNELEKELPAGGQTPSLGAIMFYEENFGMVGPFVAESLQDWIDSLGEELVIEAMKRALEQNKASWSYVKSILNAWHKKGIRTLREVEAERVAFENERRQRSGRSGNFFGVQKDIVPEWLEEEERKWKEKEREKREMEEEVTVEQVEEVMRRYFAGG